MIRGPVKANDVQVHIIIGTVSVLEDAVNQWLSNAPGDIYIHEVLYQHFSSTADSPGKASVIILFGKK